MELSLAPSGLNVVIYNRVSKGVKAEGNSLDSQNDHAMRCCREKRANVVAVINDEVSGALFKARAGIQEALDHIRHRTNGANALMCWKVDRMGRDLGILLDIRKELKLHDAIMLFSDGTEFPNNALGDAMFSFLGTVGQLERAFIRDRTLDGLKKKMDIGKQPFRGRQLYGYRVIQTREAVRGERPEEAVGTYEIDSEIVKIPGVPEHSKSEIAISIFEWCDEGWSLSRIARHLNQQGIPSPRGSHWQTGTLNRILKNPTYKGTPTNFLWQRVVDEDRIGKFQHGRVLTSPVYQRLRKDTGEHRRLSAPPLVSDALWERIQAKLAQNQAYMSGPGTRVGLLTTFLKCPLCGKSMVSIKKKYYRCQGHFSYPTRLCEFKHGFRMDVYDDAFIQGIQLIATRPDLIEAAAASYRQERTARGPQDSWEKVKADEAALERRRDATARAHAQALEREGDPEPFLKLYAELREEKVALANRANRLMETEDPVAPTALTSALAQTKQACAQLGRVLTSDGVTVEEKRQVMRAVVERIVPDREQEQLYLHLIGFPLAFVVGYGERVGTSTIRSLMEKEQTLLADPLHA